MTFVNKIYSKEEYMKLINKNLVLAGVSMMLLAGCNPQMSSVDPSSSNIMKSEDRQVIINNIPLSYQVSIDGYNSRFINDLLEASVNISNQDATQHELEYKFKWYDATGFEISESLSMWKPFVLDASDTVELKGMAITPKVETFKFYIRAKQ